MYYVSKLCCSCLAAAMLLVSQLSSISDGSEVDCPAAKLSKAKQSLAKALSKAWSSRKIKATFDAQRLDLAAGAKSGSTTYNPTRISLTVEVGKASTSKCSTDAIELYCDDKIETHDGLSSAIFTPESDLPWFKLKITTSCQFAAGTPADIKTTAEYVGTFELRMIHWSVEKSSVTDLEMIVNTANTRKASEDCGYENLLALYFRGFGINDNLSRKLTFDAEVKLGLKAKLEEVFGTVFSNWFNGLK